MSLHLCNGRGSRVRFSVKAGSGLTGGGWGLRLGDGSEFCSYGFLYSVAKLPDRAMDRATYKNPKVTKINKVTAVALL